MSAAIATMYLDRTIAGQPYRSCQVGISSHSVPPHVRFLAYAGGVTSSDTASDSPLERLVQLSAPLDLRLTLGLHGRGASHPALRFEASGSAWRTTRMPDGPATLLLEVTAAGAMVRARAWGPGAGQALDAVEALLGLDDDPAVLVPRHLVVADLARRLAGLRIGRTGRVLEALVPAILEQKVTGAEASHAYRGILRHWGERAPGPAGERGMRVAPDPAVLAGLPYFAFHPIGLERRRAELIAAVAAAAPRLERLGTAAAQPGADRAPAYAALRAFPGIGPWTAAEVGARAFGDPDAVSVGDFHLPNLVAWALAGEPRGDDERMLELLAPYAGQRGRVIRLLEASGIRPPRYGPRLAPRGIAGL